MEGAKKIGIRITLVAVVMLMSSNSQPYCLMVANIPFRQFLMIVLGYATALQLRYSRNRLLIILCRVVKLLTEIGRAHV